MLRRVIASLVVFVGICVLPLYADFISLDGSSSPVTYEFHMTSTVADGTGTTDNTGDIDAIYYKGIRIFVGYREGSFDSSLRIEECGSLDNVESPVQVSIVDEDVNDKGPDDAVTIYVAADSNVSKTTTATISFDTSGGWTRSGAGEGEAAIEIVSSAASVTPEGRTNVTASVTGDDLVLTAVPGTPLGEEVPIVGYSELSWPNDGEITAGDYTAEIKVEILGD